MQNQVSSIIRKTKRNPTEPLNILTAPTHEAYETNLALTGHNFYAMSGENIKPWVTKYRPIPSNYHILSSNEHINLVEFDLVLSQQKFGQYQILAPIAKQMGLALVSLEHTLPLNQWNGDILNTLKSMKGQYNVFISNYSAKEWGWKEGEYSCVLHGINTDLFTPGVKGQSHIISVVNDFVNRGDILGFPMWQQITNGMPIHIVGDTKGLSNPASSIEELVSFYQSATLFLNTSIVSPIPTSILEAMSCGLPVVSTNNCMIPEAIEHGKNGFLSNNPKELRAYCEKLINEPDLALEMGKQARQTILDKFNVFRFVKDWNSIFDRAANHIYKG